jgi:enoyl-[acyl-carrier protein] reductase I
LSELLANKRVFVMGLMNPQSYAYGIGEAVKRRGGSVIYGAQRPKLVAGMFKRSGFELTDEVIEIDVTRDDQMDALPESLGSPIDGLVYSIGYAKPETCLSGRLGQAPREDVAAALYISASALPFVIEKLFAAGKLNPGASVIGMSFDAQHSYPAYNWMGVAKAALEAIVRATARDYGPEKIRVNTLTAGPQRTMAATHIPGFDKIADVWEHRAILGWDLDNERGPVGDTAVYLLSDLSRATTGAVIPADGGALAMGV